MSTNNKWEALSLRDRAFLIRESVKNGVTNLDEIRNAWEHRFDGESNQPTQEKPWYKKVWDAISEGGRMARDARIGAIGAEQVRDLYRQEESEKAQELAKQYAKANIAGMAMGAGAANTAGLVGDLGITGVSTLADTAVEGNTDNLIRDLGVNTAFDILGHGTGKVINKIIEKTPIVPSNIENVLKYFDRSDLRSLDKDNLVSIINNSSNEDLEKLVKLTSRFDGDWGLIKPLVAIKKGDLHSFSSVLSEAMQKMRHGNVPNSKFIEEATNLIKENWNKYLKEGGNNNLHLRQTSTELLPAKKYVSHGISTYNFQKAIKRGEESIMPSFAILPQNTDSRWGDILFLGRKGLLGNTKIYPSDAWTPTVSMVEDINNKTNQQVLDEMMSIQNKRSIPEISLKEVENTNWNMEVPTNEVKNQNSFASWFVDQVPTTSIRGTTPYMEAKYQGNLPFSSFSHMIIPEEAIDAIEWAEKNKMPYSVYGDYNIGDKKKRYETLQQVLNDNDLLFKNGGHINHQFSGIGSSPSEDPGIWETIKGWFSKEEPKYITKDNYIQELANFRNAFEEFKPKAYWDSFGKKYTVGTGLTYYLDENGNETKVRKGDRISKEENDIQIARRVARDEEYARSKTPFWDKYHPELKFQILEAMYNVGPKAVWVGSENYQNALREYEKAKGWKKKDYDLKKIFQHADWNLNNQKWLGVRSAMRRNPQAINPDDYKMIYNVGSRLRDSLRTAYHNKFNNPEK